MKITIHTKRKDFEIPFWFCFSKRLVGFGFMLDFCPVQSWTIKEVFMFEIRLFFIIFWFKIGVKKSNEAIMKMDAKSFEKLINRNS